MANKIPLQWAIVKFGEIVGYVIGGDWGKDLSDHHIEGYKPVYIIRGTELKKWVYEKGRTAVKRLVDTSSIEKRRLIEGDILIEISGGGPEQPVGRTVVIDKSILEKFDEPLICTNFFRLIRLPKSIDSKFINYQLGYYYSQGLFDKFQTHTTNLRNLNFSRVSEEFDIFLAPIQEQKRISSKLDRLFKNIYSIQSKLDQFPEIISELKQQILHQAVTGELTKDWRKKNKLKWDVDILGNLFKMSSGKILSMKNRRPGLIKVYGGNGFNGFHNKFNTQGENIIIGRVGANCGNVHYYRGKVWVTDNAISLKSKSKMVMEYFALILRNFGLNKLSGGTGQPYISQDIVAPLQVHYPKIKEQKEILRRFKNLDKKINCIEKRLFLIQDLTESLPSLILQKAFSGQLVPQNLKDEPIEKLLERIKKEKEKLLAGKKSVKKKNFKKKVKKKVRVKEVEKDKLISKIKMNSVFRKNGEIDFKEITKILNIEYEELKSLIFNELDTGGLKIFYNADEKRIKFRAGAK